MKKNKSLLGKLLNQTPVPYKRATSDPLFVTREPANDTEGQLGYYKSVGALYAIVNGLSSAVSQVDWHLYRKAKSGQRPEDRAEVTSHLALSVWNKPNPFMTRQEFVESIQQHIDLVGDAYWYVASVEGFGNSFPMELWPVRPDKCEPIPHPTDFISGYVLTGPNGEKIPFATSQIIHLRNPDPCDPYHGTSPVKALMTDLKSNKAASLWNQKFFENGAEPGGVVELDERLTDEEFDELNARWREQHQGVRNSHRIAFLEMGKWVERKFSQKDMQFAEIYKLTDEKIRMAYRYPKAMLGTTEDVNKAVAEAAETQLYRNLVVPRLEKIKQALNHVFLPLFYANPDLVDVEFDFDNPVPDDRQADNEQMVAKAQAAWAYRAAGWNPDDILEAVGMPPMRFENIPAPQPLVPVQPPSPPINRLEEVNYGRQDTVR